MCRVLPASASAIQTAAAALQRGELVAFPTETVYGLGADARNDAAVAAVYGLKGRPPTHPLIVHLADASELWRWADRDAQAAHGVAPAAVERLADEVWPGPFTMVVHAADTVSRLVTGGQDTVALRVPADPTARALLTAFAGAVVAPSANRFGKVSPTTAAHVADEFAGSDLLVLDGGATFWGLESAVIDLTTSAPRLLRPGARPVAALQDLVLRVVGSPLERTGTAARSTGVHVEAPGGGPGAGRAQATAPRAPGTLDQHYAPATPVRFAEPGDLQHVGDDVAVIARTPSPAAAPNRWWLTLPDDPEGFGKELYAALRTLDGVGARAILVEALPEGDEWLTVRDRLTRAAAAHPPLERLAR